MMIFSKSQPNIGLIMKPQLKKKTLYFTYTAVKSFRSVRLFVLK